jgi:hypothetical protein
MATFNAAVEAVIELYFQERFEEMEIKLLRMAEHAPESARIACRKLEDLIAEQHYLDEGEEQGLW